MNYEEILRKIIRKYGVMTENIRTAQLIESKLAKRTATYADAEKFAQDIGGILTDVFREYLPEALTDGRLYRAAAEVLVQQPMVVASNDVADVAKRIQQELNENAGIGMNAIDPGLNQDQIDGIITGICNAESYDSSVELFMDQVAGFFEGEVDDFVRENADFQYKAGLSPTIERKISGKCCPWCAKLAGTYPYEDVRDRGNDVFRRHNNCHCQILYNPADGSKKRQNVRNRQWTDEGKADRITNADNMNDWRKSREKTPDQRVLEAEFKRQLGQKQNTLSSEIVRNHKALRHYTPESMYDFLKETGYDVRPLSKGGLKGIGFKDGGGYKINFNGDGEFQYHPQKKTHHGDEYWKVSGGKEGIKRYDTKGNELSNE